uniref:RAVE complex protein Rav1 C-terminal domain-containing protein n=1 Tax=Spongospora subterranea TaxID=70186 RepID=A0A0H5R4F3_9EUKA|eukprot:CRZ02924.1 hypothetical protein [Spongospora subterranea]
MTAFVGSFGLPQRFFGSQPFRSRYVISCKQPRTLILWQARLGCVQQLSFANEISCFCCNESHLLVALSSGYGKLLSFEADKFIETTEIFLGNGPVDAVALGSDFRVIISTASGIWSLNTIGIKEPRKLLHVVHSAEMVFSCDDRFLAFYSSDTSELCVLRESDGSIQRILHLKSNGTAYKKLQFSSNPHPCNLLLVFENETAILYAEIESTRFLPVLKRRQLQGATFINDIGINSISKSGGQRLAWILLYELSGHLVFLAVEGLWIKPRPSTYAVEQLRIAMPDLLLGSLHLLCCSSVFNRPYSWEDPPSGKRNFLRPDHPELVDLISVGKAGEIRSCYLSLSDKNTSNILSSGGHLHIISGIKCSSSFPLAASLDVAGTCCLWRLIPPHPLADIEIQFCSEVMAIINVVKGSVVDFSWHPLLCTLFIACTSETAMIPIRLVSPVLANSLSYTERDIGFISAESLLLNLQVLYCGSSTKTGDTGITILAAAFDVAINLYRVHDLSSLSMLHSVQIPSNFGPICSFDIDVCKKNSSVDSASFDRVIAIVSGGNNGGIFHTRLFVDANGICTVERSSIVYHSVAQRVLSVFYSAECGRIVSNSGEICNIFEVSNLNCMHVCEASLPSAHCTLGDGFLRILTARVDIECKQVIISLHSPNRDHILRQHEFAFVRWQCDSFGFDLESHICNRDCRVSAITTSPTGDVFVAIGNTVAVIPNNLVLTKATPSAILPIPVYHPSFLTELLMVGNAGIASAVISLACRSTIEENNMPVVPLSILLGKELDVFSLDDAVVTKFTEFLSTKSMPLLTAAENIQLLALADTILKHKNDRLSVDTCGSRFLIAVRLFQFEQHARQSLQNCLTSCDIAWAVHSKSTNALINLCWATTISEWSSLRALGIGYWVTSVTDLRPLMERLAQNQFLETRNPLGVMIWYLALQKKTLLLGLLKSSPTQRPMYDFFSRNFKEDRWQQAAIKNAFEFVANRKFISAIAMFLLAERLSDAVTVCLRNMNDPQLALVLVRLVDGISSSLITDIYKSELARACEMHDQWLQHIALWNIGMQSEAFQRIVETDTNARTFRPDVLNFVLTVHEVAKDSPLFADAISAYAQRGWPLLALRLIESYSIFCEYPLRQRVLQSAVCVQAASGSCSVSDDVQELSQRFFVVPDPIFCSLRTFLYSYRLFSPNASLLHDAIRVITGLISRNELSAGYIHKSKLFSVCHIVLSMECSKSFLGEAILWTTCFLIARHSPSQLLAVLRGQSDIIVNIIGLKRKCSTLATSLIPPVLSHPPVVLPFTTSTDKEIVAVVDILMQCLGVSRYIELFSSKSLPPLDHRDFPPIYRLYSALSRLLSSFATTLIVAVQQAITHCIDLARSGISLAATLSPLRVPGVFCEEYQQLFVWCGAQRISSCIADDINSCCEEALRSFLFDPVEVFRIPSDLVVSLALSKVNPLHAAIAVKKCIREANLESALRFRTRTVGSQALVDDELSSWEGCQHRFDNEEGSSDFALASYIYSVPTYRAYLAAALPSSPMAFPTATPIMQRLIASDSTYRSFLTKKDFAKGTLASDTEMSFACMCSHPKLPLYAAGNHRQEVYIWHFERPKPLWVYTLSHMENFTSVKFDEPSHGSKLAVTSSNGICSVYSFRPEATTPMFSVEAHGRTWTSQFLDSPTKLATGGTSGNKTLSDIGVWDLLSSPDRSLVVSLWGTHHTRRGITSLAYIPDRHHLVTASASGFIDIFDLRGRDSKHPIVHINAAHQGKISCLCYDAENDQLLSGGTDGFLKLWDPTLGSLLQNCGCIFPKQRFYNQHSSAAGSNLSGVFGITCISLTDHCNIVCGGTQGIVKYIKRNERVV